MASIWNLRPLSRPPVSKHFADPEQPEWEGVTLTLAPLDGLRATRFAVLKAELMRKHVTGLRDADGELVKDAKGEPVQAPEPVRCQDFSRRTPDELVVDRYAKMSAMWAGEEPVPPLSEVLGWQALLYAGWLDIANWIEDVYAGGLEPDSGNPPGPPIAASSGQPEATAESIPKSPAGEMPSSLPSSAASGLLPDGSYPRATPPLVHTRD